jgi:hypothetical protein
MTPWPHLWHLRRASREKELVEWFPIQAVTTWLGNTPTVALRHSLKTTDTHFGASLQRGDPLLIPVLNNLMN